MLNQTALRREIENAQSSGHGEPLLARNTDRRSVVHQNKIGGKRFG